MSLAAPADPASLDTLHRVVEAISSELELAPLLTRIVTGACELIGADDGTIGLKDAHRNVIRTVASYRMPDRELGAETGPGRGLAGHVLATSSAYIGRYGDLPDVPLAELADNQVIGMPIQWRGALIGVFGIGLHPPRSFRPHAPALLQLLARHAAIAINNAARYESERRRTARFELISRIAATINSGIDLDTVLQNTADAIHAALDFANVDIPLVDPADPGVLVVGIRGGGYKAAIGHVDRLPVATGIMGAAVRTRCTQLVNEVAADPRYVMPPGVAAPRAELAVPIVLGERVFGVVNVEADRVFDELDRASLEIVADHLATAIDNARLHDQARRGAVLAERQRLARDLHDNVTQILASIHLITQSLPATLRRDADTGMRRLARLHDLAQAGFAEMRALLAELQPSDGGAPAPAATGDLPGIEQLRRGALPAALSRLLAVMKPESLRARLRCDRYLPQDLVHEEALYRVCQEAVSNAIRHARASRIGISASVGRGHAVLRVRDDGCGIAPQRHGGYGLGNMRERIESLGGRFRIGPGRAGGTLVEARLPRADRAPA